MKARATTSTQKRNDREWNGIIQHLQKKNKKARTVLSAVKAMGTLFWDAEG
jgi:hypothetical protein